MSTGPPESTELRVPGVQGTVTGTFKVERAYHEARQLSTGFRRGESAAPHSRIRRSPRERGCMRCSRSRPVL